MKAFHLILIVLVSLASFSCQTNFDIEAEKDAIIKIVKNDGEAHLDRDFKRLAEGWLHSEDAAYLTSGNYYYNYYKGWNQISEYFTNLYENPLPIKGNFEQTDFTFKIHSNIAWVMYEDSLYDKGEFVQKTVISRILQKVDGEWKIFFTTIVHLTSYVEDVIEEEI
jgi:hypothetical protein